MSKFFKLLRNVIFKIIFFLPSYLIPRNKSVWLFGSFGGSFNDNAKYFFIFVNEHHPEIKAIWISNNKQTIRFLREKGLNGYYKWSWQGLYYCLRGKVYIYNAYVSDINIWTVGKAIKVNLWHGIPIKKIEFDIEKGVLSNIFDESLMSKLLYMTHYVVPDYVLSTSDRVSTIFSSAFRVSLQNCLPFGYPRNWILKCDKDELIDFINKYETKDTMELINRLAKYKKVYIYMPTWRDDNTDFIKESGIDFEILNEKLKERDCLMILKFHNNTHLPENFNDFSNIVMLENKYDVYTILPFTDCLITDYSSIYFDYKTMNKEVIFFCFDLEKYLKNREMYFDYKDIIRDELVAFNFDQLLNYINNDKTCINKQNEFVASMIGTSCEQNPNETLTAFLKDKLFIKKTGT